MFYGANGFIFDRARRLRANMTQAELLLWGFLRTKPGGLKFRRQHPIGLYIVDFYCHQLKLVIEVDGDVHENEEARALNKLRQENLEKDGLRVFRIKNDEVINGQVLVFGKIDSLIREIGKPLRGYG